MSPTKQELQNLADEHGIEVSENATKAELIDALEAEGISADGEEEESATPAAGDPALWDPAALSQRVEGTTSDPSSRVEGIVAADVPADPSSDVKSTDAGAEAYPFPPGGDVDVALLDSEAHDGEYSFPLQVEDWVVLDGSHDEVPDRLDGHIAYVLNAPTEAAPDVHPGPNAAQVPAEGEPITVRTRDEANTTLVLPVEAFKAVGRGGRNAILPIA